MKLTLIAAEGQGVFIALTFPLCRAGEEVARLPQQIETDVGERKVDFQLRRVSAPGSEALREHQTVVAQTQGVCRYCFHP